LKNVPKKFVKSLKNVLKKKFTRSVQNVFMKIVKIVPKKFG